LIACLEDDYPMLVFLQIRDFAIVERLELDFTTGFTCITGETGAGKSILVGALGLLCGNRADSGAVRDNAEKAQLAAEFELAPDSPALHWLKEAELDDGHCCLVRRVIHSGGRSRAWINGTAVTLQQLAGLGERLVEIHGQNEHLRLTRSDEQFRLIDGGGHHGRELDLVRDSYYRWQALEQEKQELLRQTPLDSGEADLLNHQVRELKSAMLTAADFLALEKEHRKLAKGSEISSALDQCVEILQSSEGGACTALHQAAGLVQEHAALDAEIEAAAGLLNEAAINAAEAASGIQGVLSRLDLSPERLREVETCISGQYDLARKHRVDPEQLETVLHKLEHRLELAGSLETRLARIEGELETALLAYRRDAKKLHHRRNRRARALAEKVTELMQDLGMQGGLFEIEVLHDETLAPSVRGDDALSLNVSANSGSNPAPLKKVASGGELSRISLAVKIVAREHDLATTQVFDEVDAGIGGGTAHAVGALLKSLAGSGQALCVTHLAQVAVFADHQLQLYKSDDGVSTTVETQVLEDDRRIDEVARMLGGQLSDQSRAHAAELLKEAAQTRH
jgi:DNA repair protein RecN (Recombination protein N)